MSRRTAIIVAGLVVLGMMLAGSAFAIVLGPPVVDRALVDGAAAITVIDPGRWSTIGGMLTEWRLYAENPGTVTLQVLRWVQGGYKVVGENSVPVPAPGINNWAVPQAQQIAVLPGDCLGIKYNGLGPGIVSLDMDGGSHRFAYATANVGEVLPSWYFQSARTYSLAAVIEPRVVPEPASVLAMATGLIGLVGWRRRR